jgi:hypothetical protein
LLLLPLIHLLASTLTAPTGAAPAPLPALVDVLCLTKRSGTDIDVRHVPDGRGHSRCQLGDFLMLASAGSKLPAHLTVVVTDPKGERLFLARRAAPTAQQLFDGYLTLEKPGTLEVVALGSPRPLTDGEVEAAVLELGKGNPLPAGAASEHARLSIEVPAATDTSTASGPSKPSGS